MARKQATRTPDKAPPIDMRTHRHTGAPSAHEPVCSGMLKEGLQFHPIVYHMHAPEEGHDKDQIRTYLSDVDDRFDGRRITKTADLLKLVTEEPEKLNGDGLLVTVPVSLAMEMWSFKRSQFSEPV